MKLVVCIFSILAVPCLGRVHRENLNSHHALTWKELQEVRQEPRTGNDNTLWPLPQQYNSTGKLLQLQHSFRFIAKGYSCDILDDAMQRYYKTLFGRTMKGTKGTDGVGDDEDEVDNKDDIPILYKLNVVLNTPCKDTDLPDVDMDEHYEITIRDPAFPALLVGNTVWGAIRGLETFSQMVWRLDDGRTVVNQSQIVDWPRFPHRGLMLDTSRHFITLPVILKNLDAMAMNKYNVFHWHIVDDQSFPYQSRTFPDLSRLGAWEPYDHVYTQEDIARVIEYARVRGIRVIAEFDTPGHSLSWGYALNKLLTPCYINGTADGTFGPINPILNSTYDTLTTFFTEVLSVFPDTYLHLGGDEVDFSCWKSNPAITAFMKEMKFGTDYSLLEDYYIQTLLTILEKIPKKHGKEGKRKQKHEFVVWQEVFDNGVEIDDQTLVHVWKDWPLKWPAEIADITTGGYRVILSTCWYLNYISYGPDWQTYYMCEPLSFNGSAAQNALVMGGEACMWGEYIDSTNVLVKLWPRASAVAERLWSDASVNSTAKAEPRLRNHRCRMDRRGIPAEPSMGPDFCSPEYAGRS